MAITFTCPQCAAHFAVSDELGGRKGKCTKCGHRITIPLRPRKQAAAVTGRFRLTDVPAPSQPASVPASSETNGGPRLVLPSQAVLAAISEQSLPKITRDDPLDASGPYRIAPEQLVKKPEPRRSKPPSAARETYWQMMNAGFRRLRGLNEFAYLISLPFVLMMFIAVLFQLRPLALVGAAGVIALNIGRFWITGFYLVVLPFRDGPLQGVLFFIPPFTFYYLYKHWKRMKKATLRFLSPAIPIACVVGAFVIFPFLRSGEVPEGASIQQRIGTERQALDRDMRKTVDDLSKSKSVQEAKGSVRRGLNKATQAVNEQVDKIGSERSSDTDAPE